MDPIEPIALTVACAERFPLVRGGGVFLAIVGAAMMLAAIKFQWRGGVLGAGALVAALATALTAVPLAAPFGAATGFQVAALTVAVVLEIAAILWASRALAGRGERARTLAVLAIVGAHFLPMAPAFGPPIVILSGLTLGNALAGAIRPGYRLAALWLLDGAFKLAVGAAMFWGDRLACSLTASVQ